MYDEVTVAVLINKALIEIPPRWANIMLYLIAIWRPPPWLWNRK